jgi:hypothetical protein
MRGLDDLLSGLTLPLAFALIVFALLGAPLADLGEGLLGHEGAFGLGGEAGHWQLIKLR